MLKQAPESNISYVNKSGKSINRDFKELSLLQRSIKIQIKSCINEENRTFYKIYRNRILTETHFLIKNEENEKIKQTTAELENLQNYNTKIYEAVKKIKHLRPPQKLLIKGKNGLTANTAEQSKIIVECFKEMFYKNKQPRTIIPLTRMTMPFRANQIRKAISKRKPKKSPGCDEIPFELIKNAPDRIHEQIGKLYSSMAETGNMQKEVTYGILKPLQNPSKAKGPLLLSSLHKILGAGIANRIKDRLKVEIPPSQAAYRPNRSTTARNESANLIMLGTSKRFDSINRNQLTEDLQNTIETDELHIFSTFLNVSLS